jgi:hypothetical protein
MRGAHSGANPRPLGWVLLELSNVDLSPEVAVQKLKRLIQLYQQDPHVCCHLDVIAAGPASVAKTGPMSNVQRWEATDINECAHVCSLHARRGFALMQAADPTGHEAGVRLVQHTWRMLRDLFASKRAGKLMTDSTHMTVLAKLVQAAAELPSLQIDDKAKVCRLRRGRPHARCGPHGHLVFASCLQNAIGGSLNDLIQMALAAKPFGLSFECVSHEPMHASAPCHACTSRCIDLIR